MSYFFVLGAPDHEMSAIEALLKDGEHAYAYLGNQQSLRVTPAQAYNSELLIYQTHGTLPTNETWVLVECNVEVPTGQGVVRIDHHSPGDPGFGQPPTSFWEASSVGQVCTLLGVVPSRELLMTAAADHCLGAAYKNQCPGIDPVELLSFRVMAWAMGSMGESASLDEAFKAAERCLRTGR